MSHVLLARGAETVAVDDAALRRIAYDRVVRKGGTDRRSAHGVAVGYRLQTPRVRGEGLCHGVGVGYIADTKYVRLGLRLGYCRATFSNATLAATSDEVDGELRLGHVFDLRRVSFQTGFVGGAGVVAQRFDTRGVAPDRIVPMGHVGALGQMLIPLPRGFAIVGEVGLHVQFIRRSSDGASGIQPAFIARPWFGLHKHW